MEEPQVFWLIWDFARSVSYFCWLGFGFFFFGVLFLFFPSPPRGSSESRCSPGSPGQTGARQRAA